MRIIAAVEARPALEAHGLVKRYGQPFRRRRTLALAGLDLSVPAGSITALVGPNGAGKSTLMRVWATLERPSQGWARVIGTDPAHDRRRVIESVGYVPQRPALYGAFSVADHLALAASLRPGFDIPLARDRLVQLAIPLDARTDELSGGQQAQVGLALALGTRAPVLLLDEPLASLDPLARREFLHVLVDGVRAAGATAILSSHVITDIAQACDRLLVLGGGRKLLDDDLTRAVAAHRVGPTGADGADRVATFLGPDGEPLILWALPADAPAPVGVRPASLEEVVLGHLAASRGG